MNYEVLSKNIDCHKIIYYIADHNEQVPLVDNMVLLHVDDWNRDLSPYKAKALKTEFLGEGDNTLKEIIGIIAKAEQNLSIEERYIGGYSLAGLFSIYAYYKSNLFNGFMSCSGSLWYPDFDEFIQSNVVRENSRIYLSLGDKEEKTRNATLKQVGDKTREFYQYLLNQPCEVIYEVNEGGHFNEVNQRVAKGIKWLWK